jgi:2',3'-cyclic-nucleotide 2'-phosphodiesterase (5'-nucleotidase family)
MNKSIFRFMKVAITILFAFLLVVTFACTGDNSSSVPTTSLTPLNEVNYPVKNFSVTTREPSIAENGKEVEINVFSTNDEHGWIFDWDFGQESPRMSKGKPYHCGLARISTLYKKLSAENPNSMIVSAGDSIQGTILSYYFNFIKTNIENPISAIFKR